MDAENNFRGSERVIDIKQILYILRKNLISILIVTIVFAAVFYVYSKLFIPKKYQASAQIIVNNISNEKGIASSSELSAAQSLAEVYTIIIKSYPVLQPVIEELELDVTYESLAKSISVSTVNSTQIITISMLDTDPDRAQRIVAAIERVASPVIKDKVEAGSVKEISPSILTNGGAPVSPNSGRNGLLGALVGLLLMLLIVFIKEFLNNTFKTEDDVYRTLGIPLLGIIPAVNENNFNRRF